MVTDLSITSTPLFGGESRRWLRGRHGHDAPLNAPVDYASFAAAGLKYVQSGCVVGWIDGTGKVGPYDASASDGRQNPVGSFLNGLVVPEGTSRTATAAVLTHFQGDPRFFPHKGGPGGLDDNAKTVLAGAGVIWFEGK